MKKLVLALALVATSPAFAGGGSNVETNVGNTAAAGALSANQQNITFNSPGLPKTTTQKFRNNPDVSVPGLTTTLTGTCMGSSSVGAGGLGAGVAIGTTWRDESCVHRLNSERMEALGAKEIAFNIMCLEEDVYWGARGTDLPCRYNQKYEDSYAEMFGDMTKTADSKPYVFPEYNR